MLLRHFLAKSFWISAVATMRKALAILLVAVACLILGILAGVVEKSFNANVLLFGMDHTFVFCILVIFPATMALIIGIFGDHVRSRIVALWLLLFTSVMAGRLMIIYFIPNSSWFMATPYTLYAGIIVILICFAGRAWEPFLPEQKQTSQTS